MPPLEDHDSMPELESHDERPTRHPGNAAVHRPGDEKLKLLMDEGQKQLGEERQIELADAATSRYQENRWGELTTEAARAKPENPTHEVPLGGHEPGSGKSEMETPRNH